MAHLSYGLTQGGCFIVLTGEVGTGKTTLCRNLLGELPENVDVALILNANINEHELLQSICDELRISYQSDSSQKQLLDLINQHLLSTFAANRHTVLIIDEAQLLSRDVLEQIRLLTNLETTKAKLLQIILIGQPELNDVLSRQDLRQLAQRVTARYHLGALEKSEIEDYVHFRLSVAGCKRPLFTRQALAKLHALTDGIPRKINVLADHALLAAYAKSDRTVDAKTVKSAVGDVFVNAGTDIPPASPSIRWRPWLLVAGILIAMNLGLWAWLYDGDPSGPLVEAERQQEPSTIAEPEELIEVASTEVESDDNTEAPPQAVSEAAPTTVGKVVISEQPLDDSSDIPEELARQFNATPIDAAPSSSVAQESSVQFASTESGIDAEQLSNLLETSADVTSRIRAFRRLSELWREPLPTTLIEPACDELAANGVVCLGFEDWEQWLRYNRPAILVLSHEQQLHRVVVTSINGGVANVMVGNQEVDISLALLQSYWTGQGVVFWKPAAIGAPFLTPGDQGESVLVARQLLNVALANTGLPLLDNPDIPEFDADMTQKLFSLQTRFNIVNDSKIGNETWLLLNELSTNQRVPVLRRRI